MAASASASYTLTPVAQARKPVLLGVGGLQVPALHVPVQPFSSVPMRVVSSAVPPTFQSSPPKQYVTQVQTMQSHNVSTSAFDEHSQMYAASQPQAAKPARARIEPKQVVS